MHASSSLLRILWPLETISDGFFLSGQRGVESIHSAAVALPFPPSVMASAPPPPTPIISKERFCATRLNFREPMDDVLAKFDLLTASCDDASMRDFHCVFSTSWDAVQEVSELVLRDDMRESNLTTAQALSIAEHYQLHPDSVRKVAVELYGRWQKGHSYTVVTCAGLARPDLPMHATINDASRHIFDHRKRPVFSTDYHHRRYLDVQLDYVSADPSTYAYLHAPHPRERRIVIVTVTR
jgi:hypothetical protein